MGNAPAHDVLGRPARDALAAEADLTAQAHHAAERSQHRRLAGAIGAQEGAHPPLIETETDPEQGLLLAVVGIELLDLEHHRGGSVPSRFWSVPGPVPLLPPITPSSFCTSAR